MPRQISFSRRAARDLQDIADYTLKNFGDGQLTKYMHGLFTELDKRCADPGFYTRVESQLGEMIAAPEGAALSFLYGKHRCYFTFDANRLRVLTLVHGARDKDEAFAAIKKEEAS